MRNRLKAINVTEIRPYSVSTQRQKNMATDSKKRLALAIIDFLSSSLNDGTLAGDEKESVEVAQSCIADSFKVDPSDKVAMQDALGGQNLLSIYSVYERLKGKSTASTTGPSSASEGRPATPSAPKDLKAPTSEQKQEAESKKSLGNSHMAKKEYAEAIRLYTEALDVVPANPIYLSNRAAAYSGMGNHERAKADAQAAVDADPKYTKGWSRLGLALFALGDAQASLEAYQQGIEHEGSGGSDAMKRGLETARKRVEEEKNGSSAPQTRGAGVAGGAGGGMPDLSSLAGMFGGGGAGGGGGGGPDLSSIMSNPMFANMAQNLMKNPEMMNNLMSNPRLKEMAQNFGGGGSGGAGGAEGESRGGAGGPGGGEGGGMPDLSSMMQDPTIAEMARNFMGGGGGAGGANQAPGGQSNP